MKKIVLVFEEGTLRDSLVRSIGDLEIEATVVESASAFMSEVEKNSYDLFVFSHWSPLWDGEKLARIVRMSGRTEPVILVGAHLMEGNYLKSLDDLFPYSYWLSSESTPEEWSKIVQIMTRYRMTKASSEELLQGVLDYQRFGNLILHLFRYKETGVLNVSMDSVQKKIYFIHGFPTYAESNILKENFGKFLCQQGIISDIEYEWARKIQIREQIKQGEALVKIGVLTNHELYRQLRAQILEKIVNCFGWEKAKFSFERDGSFTENKMAFSLNPISILFEGANRFIDNAKLFKKWQGCKNSYMCRLDRPAHLDEALIRHFGDSFFVDLDSKVRISEFARRMNWIPTQTASIVDTLVQIGVLEVTKHPVFIDFMHDEKACPAPFAPTSSEPVDMSFENLSADERATAEKVMQAYLHSKSASFYSALGVERGASKKEIDLAFKESMEIYSHKRFRQLRLESAQIKLKEITKKIQLAYETLSDPNKRSEYELLQRTSPERSTQFNKQVNAELKFDKGLLFLEQKDYLSAIREFEIARKNNPEELQYTLFLGWAIYKSAKGEKTKISKGKSFINSAIAVNPLFDEGYSFLGQICMDEGDFVEAREMFLMALKFNPENGIAMEMLQKLQQKK